MDRNKLNHRIGPLRSDSVIKLVSGLITESDQAVRAVHSCNSWLTSSILHSLHGSVFLFSREISINGWQNINQVLFYDLNIYMLPFRETCLLNFRQFCILKLIHYFNIYRFLSEVLVKAHNVIIYIHATVYNF